MVQKERAVNERCLEERSRPSKTSNRRKIRERNPKTKKAIVCRNVAIVITERRKNDEWVQESNGE